MAMSLTTVPTGEKIHRKYSKYYNFENFQILKLIAVFRF
jgi:hypothetical protein